jgi:WD repeat-containing protein 61
LPFSVTKKFTINEHEAPLYSLAKHSGNSFFSAGGDRIVMLRSTEENSIPVAILQTGSTIYSLCFIPDQNILLTGVSGGGMHVADLTAKKEIHFLVNHSKGIYDIGYSAKHKLIFTTGGDGTFSVWNTSFELLRSFKLCEEKIRCVTFDKNENTAAIGCGDGTIRIFDLQALTEVYRIAAHQQSVNALAFHPAADILISGGKDALLNIWDSSAYLKLESVPAHNYAIYSISFQPAGNLFATGSRDKTVKLWNASDCSFVLRIDKDHFDAHAFSVNKTLWIENALITAGDDKKVIGWDIKS